MIQRVCCAAAMFLCDMDESQMLERFLRVHCIYLRHLESTLLYILALQMFECYCNNRTPNYRLTHRGSRVDVRNTSRKVPMPMP